MSKYVYTIYQVDVLERFAFKDWKRAKELYNWSFELYKIEWGGYATAKDDYDLLEHLFTEFNLNHPSGFTGHSISVSDIVKISTDINTDIIYKDGDKTKYYYCDVFGWKDITKEVKGE